MIRFRQLLTMAVFLAVILLAGHERAAATSLSLGADYNLRGVAITERDNRFKSDRYYDQQLQAYLTTDLSRDVEASVRVQSITPWGLEGSTTPLNTRYPNGNGNLFVQNAYARMPHLWKDRIILTVGRQPIQWGDGRVLSDDDLGFNAIRVQMKSPFRRVPFDLEGFTAKINEGLREPGDKDLHGAMMSFDSRAYHWEVLGLWDNSDGAQQYQVGSSSTPFNVSKVQRAIYGVRAITRVRDAYVKGEYYKQSGTIKQSATAPDIKLAGSAFVLGAGAKQNTSKFGRFGALIEYSEGSGDDASTAGTDEAFRPSFSSRWAGLERKGYGHYFASTFSDAYSPAQPFAPVNSTNTGLPNGVSGIQTVHFGIDATPLSQWTFSFDYFQYSGQRTNGDIKEGEGKELGTEFDYGFEYRYSGLVTVRGNTSIFNPGAAYKADFRQKAKFSSIELALKF